MVIKGVVKTSPHISYLDPDELVLVEGGDVLGVSPLPRRRLVLGLWRSRHLQIGFGTSTSNTTTAITYPAVYSRCSYSNNVSEVRNKVCPLERNLEVIQQLVAK